MLSGATIALYTRDEQVEEVRLKRNLKIDVKLPENGVDYSATFRSDIILYLFTSKMNFLML
jgi:hypothetical protein